MFVACPFPILETDAIEAPAVEIGNPGCFSPVFLSWSRRDRFPRLQDLGPDALFGLLHVVIVGAGFHAFTLVTDLQGWPRMWAGIGNLALMIIVGLIAALFTGRWLTGVVAAQVDAFQPANRRDKFLALTLHTGTQAGQLIVFRWMQTFGGLRGKSAPKLTGPMDPSRSMNYQ